MKAGKMMLVVFVLLLLNLGVKAQAVSLSPEQCGHTIQYGEPIFCTANDSATEYEFKFFNDEDTIILSTNSNYIGVERYKVYLKAHTLYDVNSRLISTGKYKYDQPININVSEYPSGTYMVEISSCYERVMQTKIVKL